MKKILFVCWCSLLLSCASNNIENFYEAHKSDPNVTAVKVPDFMLSMLKDSSSDLGYLLKNVDDVRYMNIPNENPATSALINREIDHITSGKFTDVYRNNVDENGRNLLTINERGNRIKEILYFNNNGRNSFLIYLKGNFDPEKVQKLASGEEFDNFADNLEGKYN